MSLSVVIPTWNRPESLRRLLRALQKQSHLPDETIIVDASDGTDGSGLASQFPSLRIRLMRTSPSVCAQKNLGVRAATSDCVFLCDDDMEPEPGYVGTLLKFLSDNPHRHIVSGLVREKAADGAERDLPGISFRRLVWNTLFGLSVWADLESVTVPPLMQPVMALIRRHYEEKGNTLSRAGWPLVTQVQGAEFRAAVFGLGASIARRSALGSVPFDEVFDQRGIGDNYGCALRMGSEQPISVLTSARTLHHRLSRRGTFSAETYARRVFALDYVLRRVRGESSRHRPALIWSLFGNLLAFALHGNIALARTTAHLIRMIRRGWNPYLEAISATPASPRTPRILPRGIDPQ